MPLYEDRWNAENVIKVPADIKRQIVIGSQPTIAALVKILQHAVRKNARPVAVAFDGWYGVPWPEIMAALHKQAAKAGVALETLNINRVFKPRDFIEQYKQPYTITDDPGFGRVNTDGLIEDLMDATKVHDLRARLEGLRRSKDKKAASLVVFGPGAAVPELSDLYDLRFYFDKTRQPLLWQMWDGQLTPFGYEVPKPDYFWKDYYYCDFYLLHRQKEYAFARMDYFVEAIEFKPVKPSNGGVAISAGLKLVPRKAYDTIIETLVKYPVKEVKIFQPGPWGAYRYKDLWNVPGLECNAWNELAGPELSMLVDVGLKEPLNMPFMNIMQQGKAFVGPLLDKLYPGMFPLDVWLDDGYFPKPTPAERISMPIHNHPGTGYVQRHFAEPLGRYETYYIAETYEGANTWMGFNEKADTEEWEELCRESYRTGKPIKNWKDYVANWSSNVGDLYLIPPGTTHGHGGNQMVLEMDTCPSLAGTEYSFFMYDFVRPSWDDTTKTMTGKPVKMHLDHGFDCDHFRRADWVERNLRAKPTVIKWTKEYWMDRYSSYGPMPFEIERLHFYKRAENQTEGKFLHILTLTVGERVIVRSRKNPEYATEIELFQSCVVPAAFGDYEIVNPKGGFSTVVQFRWKKG